MKIGGIEIPREKWDEAEAAEADEVDDNSSEKFDSGTASLDTSDAAAKRVFRLPDWTRVPLSPGAPPAPRALKINSAVPQATVGA